MARAHVRYRRHVNVGPMRGRERLKILFYHAYWAPLASGAPDRSATFAGLLQLPVNAPMIIALIAPLTAP